MANTAINHDPAATFPGSSTDTAVVKWSGTGGKTLVNSGVTIDASNNVIIPGSLHLTGDEKALRFYNGSNFISIAAPSGLGADYTFEAFGAAETIETAYKSSKKGGTTVIIGLSPIGQDPVINPVELVRFEKTLKGRFYGSSRPRVDFNVMVDLYHSGQIDLDTLEGKHYTLDQINEAYADLEAGLPGRGVITEF